MPKYVLQGSEEELPLKVSLNIDSFGSVEFKVDGVTIATLINNGMLILPITSDYRQPPGLKFNDEGEIVTI